MVWLSFKNLCKDSNDLMYREGNCQEGVITRIAVYVDELILYINFCSLFHLIWINIIQIIQKNEFDF